MSANAAYWEGLSPREDAGWKPERIGYAKFLAKHPELAQPK